MKTTIESYRMVKRFDQAKFDKAVKKYFKSLKRGDAKNVKRNGTTPSTDDMILKCAMAMARIYEDGYVWEKAQ